MAEAEAFPDEMNYSKEFQEWKEWVSQNKLKSIGSLWLGLMASNICYQFTRFSFLPSFFCLSVYLSICFFLVPLTFCLFTCAQTCPVAAQAYPLSCVFAVCDHCCRRSHRPRRDSGPKYEEEKRGRLLDEKSVSKWNHTLHTPQCSLSHTTHARE